MLLRWGRTAAAPADVLRLARAADTIAAHACLWDAWREILEIGLASALSAGDRDGQAWALHQLGTRALCLEQHHDAGLQLREALALRELAGDRRGAANTRNNLRYLAGPAGAPDASGAGPRSGPGGGLAQGFPSPLSWPMAMALPAIAGIVIALGALHPLAGKQTIAPHLVASVDRSAPARAGAARRCSGEPWCVEPGCGAAAAACTSPGCAARTACAAAHELPGGPDPRWHRASHPATGHPGLIEHRVMIDDRPRVVDPKPLPVIDPKRPDDGSKNDPAVHPIDVPVPDCDHLAALGAFLRGELELPADLLDGASPPELTDKQLRLLRELLEGLQCHTTNAALSLLESLVPQLIP